MKKNPVIPFAIIAVIGVLLVIVISAVGIGQRNDIADEGNDEATEEESQDGETSDDPEEIFESNCASCHGADLSGGAGPDLTKVGSDHSEEEIHDIAVNGTGSMPPGMATDEEAEVLAKWLSEKK
ncbi:mono/diheme cytochrome c family protein [Virgibacillus halotolerans]|uniref:cytochrome c550 n=1 Tax=Virgibacillus halotolerans TaxID=1071053 RepID=UPI00195F9611|nr:cytochrome c [Virgibacillus halotolerans]MBM7597942.1 mono/diheme cytochrome c family protein [Virgibacillus halotolerans]